VKAVERVFESLDRKIAKFQQSSGLACLAHCGKCCHKPDIEASVLEFLPFAYHLHRSGKANDWYDKLEQEASQEICAILSPFANGSGGFCSEYAHRGMICRVFGFAARRDKFGKPTLVTCVEIKTSQEPAYQAAQSAIAQGAEVPMITDFYARLSHIDTTLAEERLPINKALKRALEVVLMYYTYRPVRRRAG
jgi:uncharacterized protein